MISAKCLPLEDRREKESKHRLKIGRKYTKLGLQ